MKLLVWCEVTKKTPVGSGAYDDVLFLLLKLLGSNVAVRRNHVKGFVWVFSLCIWNKGGAIWIVPCRTAEIYLNEKTFPVVENAHRLCRCIVY